MRAATHIMKIIVETPMANDKAICQIGGGWATSRTNITIGEKNGTIDTQNAKAESGLRMAGNAR